MPQPQYRKLFCAVFRIQESEIARFWIIVNGKEISLQEAVEEELKSLPDDQREILNAYYGLNGPRKKLVQIARQNNREYSAIKSNPERALQKLSASPILQKFLRI